MWPPTDLSGLASGPTALVFTNAGTTGTPGAERQLVVQAGASIATNAPGGRVLLAGQEVDNAGSLSAAGRTLGMPLAVGIVGLLVWLRRRK